MTPEQEWASAKVAADYAQSRVGTVGLQGEHWQARCAEIVAQRFCLNPVSVWAWHLTNGIDLEAILMQYGPPAASLVVGAVVYNVPLGTDVTGGAA